MVAQGSRVETFTDFVVAHELRLRESLMSACGGEAGREATADALAYAWEHWDRIRVMDNPVGYLYRLGVRKGRRSLKRRELLFDAVDSTRLPDVEPKLPEALGRLPQRQRSVVILIHCYGWSQSEVGEVLGLSKSTVRNHLERGMASLRRTIGSGL